MSVIIRLQNLPWSANSMDIRNYFQGLSIPEGGVHIVGGEQGDAFIAFSTDEDARQAMMNDGGKIKEVKIKLLLSSRNEMQKVIEQARQTSMNFQTMIQQNPVAPVTTPVLQSMGMMNNTGLVTPSQQQATSVTTPAQTTPASATGNGAGPAQNMSQQALAQKDWQGMAAMGMQGAMPGMVPGMPMPPNALSMMGMPGMNPAYFAQMAQMGLLNPMAMAQFFNAQNQKPGAMMPGAQPDATTNLQQTPSVHPVFSQGTGGPNMSNQMGGPNAMMGGMPNQMGPMGNQMHGGPNMPNQMAGGPNMPHQMGGGPNTPNPMGGGPNAMSNNPNMPNHMGGPNNMMGGMPNQMGGPMANQMSGGPNAMSNNMSGGPNMPSAMGGGPNMGNHMGGGPNPMMGGMPNQMGGPNSMGSGPNNMGSSGGPNAIGGPGPHNMGPGSHSMGGPGPNMSGPGPNIGGPGHNMSGPGPNMSGPGPNMSGPGHNMSGPGPNMGGPGPNAMGPGSNGMVQQAPAPPTITQADRSRRDGRKPSDDDDVKILEDSNRNKKSRSNSRERDRRRGGATDRRRSPNRSRARSSRSRSRERRRRERSRERREKERGGKSQRKSRSRSRDRTSRWNKNQEANSAQQQQGQRGNSRSNQPEARPDSAAAPQQPQQSPKDSSPKASGPNFNKSFTVLTPNLNLSMPTESTAQRPPVHVPFSNIDTKLHLDKWNSKPATGGSERVPEANTCLEVRNVPLNLRYTDIKNFFNHYPLYHDGIKIINDNNGRRTGILYVQFYKADVKQKALQDLNGARMLDSQVELLPIPDDIFTKAVDSFRPPRSSLENAALPKPAPILIFKVMGLPSTVQRADISQIFEGIELETIRVNRDDPNKTVAFVKIKDPSDALRFTSFRKTHMLAGKPVLVVPCFEAEFSEAVKKFPDEPDPIMTDCILIKNLPRTATDRDVCDFFSDIGLVPLKIHIMFTAQGEPSGDVFCEFQSPEEANRAVSKNDSLFGRNTVSVLLVTRQTLNEALGAPLPAPAGPGGPMHPSSLLGSGPMLGPSMLGPGPGPGPNFNDPRQLDRGPRGDPRMEGPRGPPRDDPRGSPRDDPRGPPRENFRRPPMDGPRGPPMGPNGLGPDERGPLLGRHPMDRPDMYDNPYSLRGGMRGRGRGRGGYGERLPRGGLEYDDGRGPQDFEFNGRRDAPAMESDVSPDNFGKPGCVLALENIPYRATMDDILAFFRDFELTRENIIRRYDEGGRATGDARVCLVSPSEAQRALHTLHQEQMYGRNIYMSPV